MKLGGVAMHWKVLVPLVQREVAQTASRSLPTNGSQQGFQTGRDRGSRHDNNSLALTRRSDIQEVPLCPKWS